MSADNLGALCAGAAKAALAAVEDSGGDVSVEEAELALWQAGCEVLRAVGDSAGAERCVDYFVNYFYTKVLLSQVLCG